MAKRQGQSSSSNRSHRFYETIAALSYLETGSIFSLSEKILAEGSRHDFNTLLVNERIRSQHRKLKLTSSQGKRLVTIILLDELNRNWIKLMHCQFCIELASCLARFKPLSGIWQIKTRSAATFTRVHCIF